MGHGACTCGISLKPRCIELHAFSGTATQVHKQSSQSYALERQQKLVDPKDCEDFSGALSATPVQRRVQCSFTSQLHPPCLVSSAYISATTACPLCRLVYIRSLAASRLPARHPQQRLCHRGHTGLLHGQHARRRSTDAEPVSRAPFLQSLYPLSRENSCAQSSAADVNKCSAPSPPLVVLCLPPHVCYSPSLVACYYRATCC